MAFKDHFSGHAGEYAAFRPHYPTAMFVWLAAQAPRRELAWDCGCGNGQATVALAGHFQAVIGTDPSAEQIAHTQPHERITYCVEPAERTSLAGEAVDLITVAQALHWFDFHAFYREVNRVLRPKGVLAVWTYSLQQITPELDRIINHYYRDIVGPYWPPERKYVEEEYRTIPFPFPTMSVPAFDMKHEWTFAQQLGYMHGWSATQRLEKTSGRNPLELILHELQKAWGDPEVRRVVTWPLHLRVGRKA
jgi:SAM-dependent methyltransferase